jgi:hypothetical protein
MEIATMDHSNTIQTVVRQFRARQLLGGDERPISKAKFYQLIERGEIDTYLDGRSRMTTVESIERRRARLLAEARDKDGQIRKYDRNPTATPPAADASSKAKRGTNNQPIASG